MSMATPFKARRVRAPKATAQRPSTAGGASQGVEVAPSVRAQVRRGLGTAARYGPAAALATGALIVGGDAVGGLVESVGLAAGHAAALPEAQRQEGETLRHALDLGVADPDVLRALGTSGDAGQGFPLGTVLLVIGALAVAVVLTRKGGK
jgi:hypothetical protein